MRRALAGVDVVHAQDRRAGLWTRLLPPAGAARVYTVHGLPEPYLPPPAGSERPGLRARLAYRGVDALLARRADAVITVSHAVERELVTRLGWPAERITVIPNGVELDSRLCRGESWSGRSRASSRSRASTCPARRWRPRSRRRASRCSARATPPPSGSARGRSASTGGCRSPGTCRRARRSRGWRSSCSVLHGERAARAAGGDGGRRAGRGDAGRRRARARARGHRAAGRARRPRRAGGGDRAAARRPGARARPGGGGPAPRRGRRRRRAAMVDRTLALYEGLAAR